jgi:hypothetical protein
VLGRKISRFLSTRNPLIWLRLYTPCEKGARAIASGPSANVPQAQPSHRAPHRPVVKTKSVDVVSSDFFTDSYLYAIIFNTLYALSHPSYFSYIAWRDDRFLPPRASSGESYDDKKYWRADPEIMNSESTAIPLSGNFYVNHGPPLFTGLPESIGGAWIWGFTRLARRYYAQYATPFRQRIFVTACACTIFSNSRSTCRLLSVLCCCRATHLTTFLRAVSRNLV